MATYLFEIEGCTAANLAGVEGSLVNVPARCVIYKTGRGSYILFAESELALEQLSGCILSVLAPTVILIPAIEIPSVILRRH